MDSLRDLNSDEGMFFQNYNTCASEKKERLSEAGCNHHWQSHAE
jgi:hypothetical protein